MFESLLEEFIHKCGSSTDELYEQMQTQIKAKAGGDDDATTDGLLLGTLLVLSVDFDVFLTTILDSAKRQQSKSKMTMKVS